jgi:hypothetical protein
LCLSSFSEALWFSSFSLPSPRPSPRRLRHVFLTHTRTHADTHIHPSCFAQSPALTAFPGAPPYVSRTHTSLGHPDLSSFPLGRAGETRRSAEQTLGDLSVLEQRFTPST